MGASGRLGEISELWLLVLVQVMWMLCNNVQGSRTTGWLMLGKWSSENFVLPCNASYCVNLPCANLSMPFTLHRCVGVEFWEEQFAYDGAKLEMFSSTGVPSCLDVVGINDTEVKLQKCNAMLQSQRWSFVNGTKLRNGNGQFLMAPPPLLPYEWNVPVLAGQLNHSALSDWTFMDRVYLNAFQPQLPPSGFSNLVQNGRFLDNWGGIQAQGSKGDMTLFCSWTILGSAKSYLVRNTISNWSMEWGVMLGAISQTLPTHPGLRHILQFDVKPGNGTSCSNNNLLVVTLTPSSSESNVFNVQGSVLGGGNTTSFGKAWKTEAVWFHAKSSTVNLTFATANSSAENCSVIRNVEVRLEDEGLASLVAAFRKRVVYLSVLMAFFAAVAAAVSVVYFVASRKNRLLFRELTQRFSAPFSVSAPLGGGSAGQSRTQRITYAYLHAITDGFSSKNSIGAGGFANVYKGTTPDGSLVAIKKAYKLQLDKGFKQEIDMLGRVHHRRLVKFLGYCDENDAEQILVFEYMHNGSLQQQLHCPKISPLTAEIRFRIAQDVAQGLEYLHHGANPLIIHRDVTSANVLLDEKFSAKVADFGIFKLGLENTSGNLSVETNVKGSYGYIDPRQMESGTVSTKSDVYSFGVVLLELITGRKAIDEESLLSHWAEGFYEQDDETSLSEMLDPRLKKCFDRNKLKVLLYTAQQCLLPSREDRPCMSEVVRMLSGECTTWKSRESNFTSSKISPRTDNMLPDRNRTCKRGLMRSAVSAPDRAREATEIEITSILMHSRDTKSPDAILGRWIAAGR